MSLPPLPRAYIVGPYSNDDPLVILENVKRAAITAIWAAQRGYLPVLPHMMHTHHLSWDEALDYCTHVIRGLDKDRDVVVLSPGWEGSKGSRKEVLLGQFLSLKIIEGGCDVAAL
jgi:hypothetical protein